MPLGYELPILAAIFGIIFLGGVVNGAGGTLRRVGSDRTIGAAALALLATIGVRLVQAGLAGR